MSLKVPIKNANQMQRPIEWASVPVHAEDSDAAERRTKECWWATNYAGEIEERMMPLLKMRDKILSFGGEQVCLPTFEEDLDKIMERGEFLYGKGSRLKKHRPNNCHENSAYLWNANKGKCQIMTGYALSPDGLWRQHTWIVQPLATKYRIWETTVPRVAYFGVVFNDEECEEFFSHY